MSDLYYRNYHHQNYSFTHFTHTSVKYIKPNLKGLIPVYYNAYISRQKCSACNTNKNAWQRMLFTNTGVNYKKNSNISMLKKHQILTDIFVGVRNIWHVRVVIVLGRVHNIPSPRSTNKTNHHPSRYSYPGGEYVHQDTLYSDQGFSSYIYWWWRLYAKMVRLVDQTSGCLVFQQYYTYCNVSCRSGLAALASSTDMAGWVLACQYGLLSGCIGRKMLVWSAEWLHREEDVSMVCWVAT